MAKIVIVVGHPRADTFCGALGEAYRDGAAAAGHEATVVALASLAFDPILRGGYSQVQPREPDLEAAYLDFLAADHLVFIFPLWLGDMPALLKGFLERILQPELIRSVKAGAFAQVLKGKSARIIVTMGMPAFVYRWWFGSYAVKILKRNILRFMGVGRVCVTVRGSIETVSAERRHRWIEAARELGRRAG